MIRNYLQTAFRNLIKDKAHSFINVVGLSIGMAVAILIGLWVYDEVSFDRNFNHYGRIAQVYQDVSNNGEVQTWTSVPYPLAEVLRKNYGSDFSHIIMGVSNQNLLTFNNNKISEQGFFFEPGAPEMFNFKMIQGDWKSLDNPSSILLSKSAAKAFFGNDNPVNKLIKIDEFPPVKVTGVYEDFPRNSSFADVNYVSTWQFFYSSNDGVRTFEDPWRPNFAQLFVQLADNADIKSASLRIRDAKLKMVNAQLAKKKPELFLQPMSKWHLYAEFKDGKNVGGAIQYVWMFGIIGIFVLLLACINFMNLSTARSEKRAREVGIRKTLGSMRVQLIIQFFSESLLTVICAFALALVLAQLAIPFFNDIAGKQLDILWRNSSFWMLCSVFVLATAIIAGSYPALYLSSFNPIKVLKGTFKAGRFAAIPRKVLVVLQFTVSVTLIIGTIIVYKQIQVAKGRPVGYSREGLVSIPGSNDLHNHFNALRDALLTTGAVTSIAESQSPTTSSYSSTSGLSWRGKDPNLSIDFGNEYVSYDYGKTIDWKIATGRDFSRQFITDSNALILNEAAAKFIGFKDPVGETMMWWGQPFKVIGVVNNIITQSPYSDPKPTVFALLGPNDAGGAVDVKINPSMSASQAIAKIAPVVKQFNPGQPWEYHFADDEYAKKFEDEERIGKLASLFTILAIVISCLGLFGLTSFVAEQRKKEIGLRKVMGASIFSVWNLLSKDFVRLVIISFFVSVPVSYSLMHSWLQNYQYRTQMPWWIFAAAGIGCLAITLAVVSFQAIKAALANPVTSLKNE